jgi:hypothetical protein
LTRAGDLFIITYKKSLPNYFLKINPEGKRKWLLNTRDLKDGSRAFLGKRAPNFKGR